MEEEREEIQDIARSHGLTEAEARVFYHLVRATESYRELPEEPYHSWGEWTPHATALHKLLALRVVRRDYPEGWRTGRDVEEAERAEESEEGNTT